MYILVFDAGKYFVGLWAFLWWWYSWYCYMRQAELYLHWTEVEIKNQNSVCWMESKQQTVFQEECYLPLADSPNELLVSIRVGGPGLPHFFFPFSSIWAASSSCCWFCKVWCAAQGRWWKCIVWKERMGQAGEQTSDFSITCQSSLAVTSKQIFAKSW